MLRLGGAAAFQDVQEADDVGVHVGARALEAVADAGLGGEIDHRIGLDLGEEGRDAVAVGEVDLRVAVAGLGLEVGQAGGLQRRVVVGVEVVEAHDLVAARQQPARQVEADEAGRAGDENAHRLPPSSLRETLPSSLTARPKAKPGSISSELCAILRPCQNTWRRMKNRHDRRA